jgi:hypothetical protein
MEPYHSFLGGTLTEIGEGYVLVDDSILCADEKDGVVYKVLTDDLRARRCLEYPGSIAVGDLVVVEYSGSLDEAHGNTVTGAFSITEAILEGGAEAHGADGPEDTEAAFTQAGIAVPE